MDPQDAAGGERGVSRTCCAVARRRDAPRNVVAPIMPPHSATMDLDIAPTVRIYTLMIVHIRLSSINSNSRRHKNCRRRRPPHREAHARVVKHECAAAQHSAAHDAAGVLRQLQAAAAAGALAIQGLHAAEAVWSQPDLVQLAPPSRHARGAAAAAQALQFCC